LREGKIEQIGTPAEIYDHPATPFVYDFLGHVNAFAVRVRAGALEIGAGKLAAPAHAGEGDTPAVAFVRPHDIRVSRSPGPATLKARVKRCNAVGPFANLELERLDSHEPFSVQLSQEQFRELQPQPGEELFVELRNVKVFPEDYSI